MDATVQQVDKVFGSWRNLEYYINWKMKKDSNRLITPIFCLPDGELEDADAAWAELVKGKA